MSWENAMVHQKERPLTHLPLRRARTASWTVLALLAFTALATAGDRDLYDWNRDSPCRFEQPKPEPVETPARTISAARLLFELAKDAVGVSKLHEGLFAENGSEASTGSGVSVLIRFLMYFSGGKMIPSSPELAEPYSSPGPRQLMEPLGTSRILQIGADRG